MRDEIAVAGGRSPWLHPLRVGDLSGARIVFFPHSGASPSAFRDLALALPPDFEVLGIEYPGHGPRRREAVHRQIEPLAEGAATALRALPEMPTVFFGHSMGSVVAFETCRRLRSDGRSMPQLLIASSHRAPTVGPIGKPYYEHSDEELLAAIAALDGVPIEMREDAVLMREAVALVRMDSEASETYRPPEERLDLALAAYAGDQDPNVSTANVGAWQNLTTATLRLRWFGGGHFYVFDHPRATSRAIQRDLYDVMIRQT